MSCKISKSGALKVNNGTRIWGGVVSSVTINLGFGNTKSNASVTVVRKDDENFQPPSTFDEVTITIGDSEGWTEARNYKMLVKGYSVSQSATSSDSLQVELCDTSHKTMDLNIIALEDSDRTGSSIDYEAYSNGQFSVHLLGEKWVQKISDDALGNIIPKPDGQWMKARPYWENQRLRALSGLGTGPITEAEMEDKIHDMQGQVLYEVKDIFNQMNIPFPAGIIRDRTEKLSFSGTYREVLEQLANYYGFFYWWDMKEEKIRLSTEIDVQEGREIVKDLEERCVVTSKTTTVDASSTYAKACFSQFDAGWEWNPKAASMSAGTARVNKAKLLDYKYEVRSCLGNTSPLGDNDGPTKTLSDDMHRAIRAAFYGPKVYALYVIQSVAVMNSKRNQLNCPPGGQAINAAQGAGQVVAAPNAADLTKADPLPWGENTVLNDLYSWGAGGGGGCNTGKCLCAFLLNGKNDAVKNALGKAAAVQKENNEKDNQKKDGEGIRDPNCPPEDKAINECKTVDAAQDGGQGAKNADGNINLELLQGILIKNGSGINLFDDNQNPDATDDLMYNYFASLGTFLNRYYIVYRGGGPSRDWFQSSGDVKRTYGYYISAQSQPRGQGINGRLNSVHPALRLDAANLAGLTDLFKTLEFIHRGDDKTIPVELYPPVLDFLAWLDKDPSGLENYFASPGSEEQAENVAGWGGGAKYSCTPILGSDIDGTRPQPALWFIDTGAGKTADRNGDLPQILKNALRAYGAPEGNSGSVIDALYQGACNMRLVTMAKTDLHKFMGDSVFSDQDLRLNAASKQYIWNQTTSGAGKESTRTTPYNFYCNWLALPNMTQDDNVFTAKLEKKDVTGTELGLTNGEDSKFTDILASPFSAQSKLKMAEVNRTMAQTQAQFDSRDAESLRISFALLEKDLRNPDMSSPMQFPTPEEGLESLSLSIDEGIINVEMTVGDTIARRVAKNFATNRLNTAFNQYASTAFGPTIPQLSSALQYYGIM